MKNNSAWGDYLSKLYGNAKIGEGKEVKINTNYKDFEDSFYKTAPIENAKEPQIPDEEYLKEVELSQQYLPETDDAPVIEDETNKFEDIVEPAEDEPEGMPLPSDGFREILAHHMDDDYEYPTEEPDYSTIMEDKDEEGISKDEFDDFLEDELKAFKELNGYVDEVKEHIEQPTETKVKSVKVSKPEEVKAEEVNAEKSVEEKKVKEVKKEDKKKEKPVKEAKPKSPRKPKK